MNGNTPYAGLPGETAAGQRAAADVPDLSRMEKRLLHRDVSRIAARTREFLPDEYVVDSEISTGATGPQVTVAVRPPIGHAVSAGFTPNFDETEHGVDGDGDADPDSDDDADTIEDVIAPDERNEVARGLAASAALQVKQAMSNNVRPTAR